MLFMVKLVASALVSVVRPSVYPADAPAVCRMVEVIAGVFGERKFAPL